MTGAEVPQQLVWGPRGLLSGWQAGGIYSVGTRGSRGTHVSGMKSQDSAEVLKASQQYRQLEIYLLFISGIFLNIFRR